jgi:hypothetical protein
MFISGADGGEGGRFRLQFSARFQAKPCRNAPPPDEDLDTFVRAMWKAFPGARSENELADMVANHLTTERRRITNRTVRNWLRKTTTPHFRYVTRVLAALDDDQVAAILMGRRP